MTLKFPLFTDVLDEVNNYDLFMKPNGVYWAKKLTADNYLYPMYNLEEKGVNVVSTSVYALIQYKKKFVRNPRFQTTNFYRPTYQTIDAEIQRVRTTHRRSSMELTDPDEITELGVKLIQDYITEMENKYPGWVHILCMGGKDSQNIALASRKERWVILSGEPNAPLNKKFVEKNELLIEKFISADNETKFDTLNSEITASDCAYDTAHFRWVAKIQEIVDEFDGKAILWMGTSGDGCFSKNHNHFDKDYYAVHDLHVGMAMGILHQMFKNLLNIPVVSPYQSPKFLDELFYRFDPYFVDKSGDVREKMGELLLGRPVKYPEKNPEPLPWKRERNRSIPIYISELEAAGVTCHKRGIRSRIVLTAEAVEQFFEKHTAKKRTRLSRILFPTRKALALIFPKLRNKRHDIAAAEIR